MCAIGAYNHYICEFKSCSWRGVLDTTLCDQVCQRLTTGWWFSHFNFILFNHFQSRCPLGTSPWWPLYMNGIALMHVHWSWGGRWICLLSLNASHIIWPCFGFTMRKTLQKQTIPHKSFKTVEIYIASKYKLLYYYFYYVQVVYLQFYIQDIQINLNDGLFLQCFSHCETKTRSYDVRCMNWTVYLSYIWEIIYQYKK
jgi:hypothetical protein